MFWHLLLFAEQLKKNCVVSFILFSFPWWWFWAENSDWEPEPFDFLIDGELVRMSLERFLLVKSISAVFILYLSIEFVLLMKFSCFSLEKH